MDPERTTMTKQRNRYILERVPFGANRRNMIESNAKYKLRLENQVSILNKEICVESRKS